MERTAECGGTEEVNSEKIGDNTKLRSICAVYSAHKGA